VGDILRRSYLTPGGARWYGFTTLRAINRYYASAPRWADRVAVVANVIDYLVVTLRERGVKFKHPALLAQPVVGAPTTLEIPWTANPGAELPAGLRFAVRWSPAAVVESSSEAPTAVPGAAWQLVRRVDGPTGVVRLALRPPVLPGVWRLDVEARDSDGATLPRTDRVGIRSLGVRVVAPGEVNVALSAGDDGGMVASVSVAPAEPAVAAGGAESGATAADEVAAPPRLTGASLEVWTLPLDPAVVSSMTLLPLPETLSPTSSWTVSLGAPTIPAVVVARIAGGPGSVVRALPAVALTGRDEAGRLTLESPAIASPRDELLLGRTAGPASITARSLDEPGAIEVGLAAAEPSPVVDAALAGVEEAPGPHSVLIRTLSADTGSPAAPADALVQLPADLAGAAQVPLAGIPAGVRLVMAGLVPRDGGPVDPATISLAWIDVAAISLAGAAPN
jgi:hypothetical protein